MLLLVLRGKMRLLAFYVCLLCCAAEGSGEEEVVSRPVFAVDDIGGVGRVFDGIGAISGGGVSGKRGRQIDQSFVHGADRSLRRFPVSSTASSFRL